jgi:hypothetical protein
VQPPDAGVKDLEEAIRKLASAPPEQALPHLTAVANRAIIELHKVARDQANRRRGEPDWGKWAGVANAARSSVLQVAAVRDSLKRLGAGAPPSGSGPRNSAPEGSDGAPPA